ncbi:hypothetical protein BHM03_00002316 [Ensete ventricosum]|nr:hypothetical protein BHM03_00002316 [Ensete ventricosum]
MFVFFYFIRLCEGGELLDRILAKRKKKRKSRKKKKRRRRKKYLLSPRCSRSQFFSRTRWDISPCGEKDRGDHTGLRGSIEPLLEEADIDKDGKISLSEFRKLLRTASMSSNVPSPSGIRNPQKL